MYGRNKRRARGARAIYSLRGNRSDRGYMTLRVSDRHRLQRPRNQCASACRLQCRARHSSCNRLPSDRDNGESCLAMSRREGETADRRACQSAVECPLQPPYQVCRAEGVTAPLGVRLYVLIIPSRSVLRHYNDVKHICSSSLFDIFFGRIAARSPASGLPIAIPAGWLRPLS